MFSYQVILQALSQGAITFPFLLFFLSFFILLPFSLPSSFPLFLLSPSLSVSLSPLSLPVLPRDGVIIPILLLKKRKLVENKIPSQVRT
jgi:hypothetical protein